MSRIVATYHLHCPATEVEARARAMAVEQSVEMPLEAIRHPHVLDEIVARVGEIQPLGPDRFRVDLHLATATTGMEAGQLMNMLFGNSSLLPDVELADLATDDALAPALPGPRFGIEGIRALTGAWGRALTASALKPQGLPPAELAALAGQLARAGIDIIKDDHGLADQAYAPFEARVTACQAAVDQANRETGGQTLYVPSLNGGPSRLLAQARFAKAAGCRMVMLAPMVSGLPLLAELAADQDTLGLPILAHPALGGAARIAPPLLIGKLFRWFGADAVIFPNHGGRFSYSTHTCQRIAEEARIPGHHRPALPVPAGGMSLARVDEMLDFYGPDVLLLIGGNLLAAGSALVERGQEFARAVRQRATSTTSPRVAAPPPQATAATANAAPSAASTPLVRRFLPDSHRWDAVEKLAYKQEGSAPFRDISRQTLFRLQELAGELRYFEVQPGGFSTLERHQHVHAVLVLRGHGQCLLGDNMADIAPFDLVTIPPMTWHQFRPAPGHTLGFLCLVNVDRDKPQLPDATTGPVGWPAPHRQTATGERTD